jgi:hypothetical protein
MLKPTDEAPQDLYFTPSSAASARCGAAGCLSLQARLRIWFPRLRLSRS